MEGIVMYKRYKRYHKHLLKLLGILGLAWLQICSLCSPVRSQDTSNAEHQEQYSAVVKTFRNYMDLEDRTASVKNRIISVQIDHERLADALQQLAGRLGLSLSYSKELFPREKRVTVHLNETTVDKVVTALLKDTGLDYLISANGHMVFFKKPKPFKKQTQEKQELVTGTVTDAETGAFLPGVNIGIKGTTMGTSSGGDGQYSLNVPSLQDTLVFSFIGYQTKEVPLNGQTEVDVALQPTTIAGEELVVVDYGYGTINKIDMTGAVSSVSGEELRKKPVASLAEAIRGRVPGVSIISADGAPGAEMDITIRGGGSVTQDNSPLFVVDGFIVGSIRDIPPTDIASISVLKDAAATAIYGSRAANGVIVITTKEPKAGKINISYNGYAKVRQLPPNRKYEVLSPYEYVMANYEYAKLRSEADLRQFEKFYGVYDDLGLYKEKKPTDWQEELFGDPKLSQYHNLSINGGTQQTQMVLSLTHNNEEGLMTGSAYQRSVINFKLNQKLAENLQLDLSGRLTKTIIDGAGTSGGQLTIKDAIATRPINGLVDELDIDLGSISNENDYRSFLLNLIDPTELAEQDWRKRTTNDYVLGAGLSWSIMDNLEFSSSFTSQKTFRKRLRYYGPLTGESRKEGNSLPLGEKRQSEGFSYRWYNTLEYKFKNLGKHQLDLLLGQEIHSSGGKGDYVRAENFRESMNPDELFANMTLGNTVRQSTYYSTKTNLSSFFGRLNYQWDNRFLMTATLRRDASSKFSKDNRVGYFPAVAIGWRLSEEKFMENIEFIDQLKLRVSYGLTGNNRIDDNATLFLFSADTKDGPGFGSNTKHAYYSPDGEALYNPNLKWETTISRNVGLDFALFQSRIQGSLNLYYKTTKDLLLLSAISQTSGFTYQWNNIGSTSNKGIELGLNTFIIDKDDFSLSANVNFAINRSKIEELDGTKERFYQSNWASTDLKDRNDYYLQVGSTLGLMYGYVNDGMYTVDDFQGYNEETGEYILKESVPNSKKILGVNKLRPGYMKLKDLNNDGIINSDDRRVIGHALPKAQGGFGVNARYKNFDFSVFFNWRYGNDVYNTGKIEFNQFYRVQYGNMLQTMSPDNRYTYIDVDGSITGTPGGVVTDLDQLRKLNESKDIWSGSNSFGGATAVLTDWAVEDGSFLRLSTVSLGYTLPVEVTSKMKLSSFRIYVTGYNLWLWTAYSGYDPGVSTAENGLTPGVDYSAYPKSRSLTLGVNITF